MKTWKCSFSVVALLLLQSCATQISQERLAAADYGVEPSEKYEQIIKDRFYRTLIDPTAPLYEFEKPRKGFTKKSPVFNTEEHFGWKVCGTVNSKNRFGGYVGRIPFFVLFQGDTIVEFISGDASDRSGFINIAITEACRR